MCAWWRRTTYLAPILLAIACASASRGDGIAFKGRDMSSWRPLVENEQLAAIHHADGVEKMILAINVNLEDESDKALWIVPVPGTPEDVRVSIGDEFPRFFGFDPRQRASSTINLNAILLRATQVYPLLFEFCFLVPSLSSDLSIAVHAEVEKHGLRCELLTAQSTGALCEHLRDRGVDIEPEQLDTLEPYLTGEHVLIAAWIASREQLVHDFPDLDYGLPGAEAWPCIFVEFPTEKAFFPLRPTSAYGDANVPLRLFISGFVEPQTAASIVNQMKVGYYRQEGDIAHDAGLLIGAGAVDKLEYTSIRLDVAARRFTDDLWFVPAQLTSLRYAAAVQRVLDSRAGVLSLVVVWLLLSYVCAGLAGLIVWRRWKQPAMLGFWNMLTLIGLTAVLHRRPLSERFGAVEGLTERQLQHRFVGCFSLIFVILSALIQCALQTPLILR